MSSDKSHKFEVERSGYCSSVDCESVGAVAGSARVGHNPYPTPIKAGNTLSCKGKRPSDERDMRDMSPVSAPFLGILIEVVWMSLPVASRRA